MREVRAAPARHVRLADLIRAVAQLGRGPGSGPGGRGFKSHQPDVINFLRAVAAATAVGPNLTRPILLPKFRSTNFEIRNKSKIQMLKNRVRERDFEFFRTAMKVDL